MSLKPEMTDHPCNCSTCSIAIQENEESRFKFCKVVDHYTLLRFDGKWIPYTQTAQDIMKCGCLSHPQSREYLMAPVLKELGNKYYIDDVNPKYFKGLNDGCDYASNLIKKGVDGK